MAPLATGDATAVGTLAEVGRAEISVPLADAVIWLFALLELSNDDIMDPDAVVLAMAKAGRTKEGLVVASEVLADGRRVHGPDNHTTLVMRDASPPVCARTAVSTRP